MNRVIKFRGKRVVDKEWVYGYYSYDQFDDLHSISFYVEDGFEEYGVIPSTLGQFTGLHDKDGNDIYDDDIVDSNGQYNNCISRVVFEDGAFKAENSEYGFEGEDLIDLSKCLVIGNIHDNPELLKS